MELDARRDAAAEALVHLRETAALHRAQRIEFRDEVAADREEAFERLVQETLRIVAALDAIDSQMEGLRESSYQQSDERRTRREVVWAELARQLAASNLGNRPGDLGRPPSPSISSQLGTFLSITVENYSHYLFGYNETPVDWVDHGLNVGVTIGRGMAVVGLSGLALVSVGAALGMGASALGLSSRQIAALATSCKVIGAGISAVQTFQWSRNSYDVIRNWDSLSGADQDRFVGDTIVTVFTWGLSWRAKCFTEETGIWYAYADALEEDSMNTQGNDWWVVGLAVVGVPALVVASRRRRKRATAVVSRCLAPTDSTPIPDSQPEAAASPVQRASTNVAARDEFFSRAGHHKWDGMLATPRGLGSETPEESIVDHSPKRRSRQSAILAAIGRGLAMVACLLLIAGGVRQTVLPHRPLDHRDARMHSTAQSRPSLQDSRGRVRPITEARVGDRLIGRNPIREQVEGGEPEPATWRKISLCMTKKSGLGLWIDLLRPLTWIEEYNAKPGSTIFIDLYEMGAVGDAEVTYLGPCPTIQPGTGTVVTGTFKHQADENTNVVHLKLEDQIELTGVTDNHLYWSADRQDFVEVGNLRTGELIDTEYGLKHVVSVTAIDCTGFLYNIETTEHVYRVGSLGTLVHNSCLNRGGSYADLNKIKIAGKEVAHHMPQNAAGILSRGKGPALGMSLADYELTRTFRWKGAITNVADAQLTPMKRLELDIADIRKLFGDKYDAGIEEMLKYARSLSEFQ